MNEKINLKLFDIDDTLVTYFHIDLIDNYYHIYIDVRSTISCCPTCGSIKLVGNGNHKKNLITVPISNRYVTIHTTLKRILCHDCGSSFVDHHSLYDLNTKFTHSAIVSILTRLKLYKITYSQVARDFGVSTQKIVDMFDMFIRIKRKHLPRILLIDEFFFCRHAKYKYPTLLMNFKNNLIIDIIESRRHEVFSSYLYSISKKETKKK